MVFWHAGATLWLFRWIFRDPKVDVRFLVLGALIPDLIDLPLGGFLYGTPEIWFHSLSLAAGFMVVVLLVTRRGRRRRAWMALGVGWLFHLVLDGLWAEPQTLFWPFFGLEPWDGEQAFWSRAIERALSDPWRWVLEAGGLVYLAWLWMDSGLARPDRRQSLMRTGRLPAHVAEPG